MNNSLLFAMRNLFVVLSSFLDKERDSYFKTSSVSYPFKQREKGYIFLCVYQTARVLL